MEDVARRRLHQPVRIFVVGRLARCARLDTCVWTTQLTAATQAQVELTALDAVRWTQEECLHLLRNLRPVRRCAAGSQTSSVMQVLCVLVMRGKAVRTALDAVCRTVHRAVRHCRCAGRASGRRRMHVAGPRTRTSAMLRRCAALPLHVCARSCDS